VDGNIRVQTAQMLNSLKTTIESAGGALRDVVQINLSIVDRADSEAMSEVYASYFEASYPTRSTVAVKQLIGPPCSSRYRDLPRRTGLTLSIIVRSSVS
jgi:2-iminobutanoate/2-iminopropanoate deaminase